jgi:hypothetical protein
MRLPLVSRTSFVKREVQAQDTVTVRSILSCRSFKKPCNKAAASEIPRRTAEYVEGVSDVRTQLRGFFKLLLSAEVVKWQTRTFEGRVAQAVRVQVPPSAPSQSWAHVRAMGLCCVGSADLNRSFVPVPS